MGAPIPPFIPHFGGWEPLFLRLSLILGGGSPYSSVYPSFWGVGAPIPPFIPFIAKMGPLFLSLGGAIIGGVVGGALNSKGSYRHALYMGKVANIHAYIQARA